MINIYEKVYGENTIEFYLKKKTEIFWLANVSIAVHQMDFE